MSTLRQWRPPGSCLLRQVVSNILGPAFVRGYLSRPTASSGTLAYLIFTRRAFRHAPAPGPGLTFMPHPLVFVNDSGQSQRETCVSPIRQHRLRYETVRVPSANSISTRASWQVLTLSQLK